LVSSIVWTQETRGTILGTVQDPNGAVVPGATVVVTNVETNTSRELTTNDSGYFEAPYLQAGNYSITVTAPGFKKYTRQGFALTVNSRSEVNIVLEVGDVTEVVTVTAAAPLLETTTASGSTTLSNRQVMDLPVLNNSAIILARSVPGIQWTAAANYLGPHSNIGASAINAAGGVGGTEFTLDGVPNLGGNRRIGHLPYTDAVAEMKVETSPFDASKGHSSGATVSVVTKSGTNEYHGSLTWQHWQQRWNATPSATNAAYWGPIVAAEARGDTATAQRLRSQERQPTGRSNNWAGVVGGPVRIPWVYDGRDRLFFFFNYNGLKEVKTEEPLAVRRTVPTLAQRRGDFSELLRLDPVRYQIYDPRTARQVTGGPCGNDAQGRPRTCVVRDPFPNNQVPILNPMYESYLKLIPLPNNVPGIVGADGVFNYLATGTPFNWDYEAYGSRIDWMITPRHKVFGRWSINDFIEDRGDWTYETARGLHQNGLNRNNKAVTIDYVFTITPTTILNVSAGYNRFRDGDTQNAFQRSLGPDTVGLPAYLTQRAGDFKHLPQLDFSDNSYSDFSRTFPGQTRFSIGTVRGELSKVLKTHSLRMGYDLRNHYRQFNSPGNTSGFFQFRNTYTRQTNLTTTAGLLAHEWASFMLGVPNFLSVAANDSRYLTNRFYGGYIQDDWRVSPRLTINVGLRFEREAGFRERFNRAVVNFDPHAELPITAGAQAAYAANPLPELPASQFIVRGGSVYLGKDGAPTMTHDSENVWMPRIGVVYQFNARTVLRGGYGLYFDTNNVLDNDVNQFGYSRDTATTISNDNGLTFNNTNLTSPECQMNVSNCRTLFSDPFPVRADGTRFNVPVGNALGLMAGAGRNLGYYPRDWRHARQQRWRFSIQRELSKDMVLEVAYTGSYSDRIGLTRRLDPLPAQYWATGLIRNNALANDLNSTRPNPFLLSNFSALQTQNPVLYQDMSSNGFFTGTTRAKNQLLRPFPHANGSTLTRQPLGESKYHDLELTLTRRFSQGLSYQVSYILTSHLERTVFANEFDEKPSWQPSNTSRPHHLMFNALWELPVGKGRAFLSDTKILSAVLGGWQVGAIYHIQSGPAYNLGNWFFYGSDLRELALSTDVRNTDTWFNWRLLPGAARDYSAANRSAYEARIRQIVPQSVLQQMGNICGPQSNQPCTYENVIPRDFQPNSFHRRVFPTRLNWLREDYMNQVDLNLARNIGLTEGLRMQFRVDLINAFNQVHWQGPNTDISSSNFGRVTSQGNIPRWIQFQLRLTF
jgi:hypothetical protein